MWTAHSGVRVVSLGATGRALALGLTSFHVHLEKGVVWVDETLAVHSIATPKGIYGAVTGSTEAKTVVVTTDEVPFNWGSFLCCTWRTGGESAPG